MNGPCRSCGAGAGEDCAHDSGCVDADRAPVRWRDRSPAERERIRREVERGMFGPEPRPAPAVPLPPGSPVIHIAGLAAPVSGPDYLRALDTGALDVSTIAGEVVQVDGLADRCRHGYREPDCPTCDVPEYLAPDE